MRKFILGMVIAALVGAGFTCDALAQNASGPSAASLSQDSFSAYVIDYENVLQIDVYYGKGEKISQKVRVTSAGNINFPLVGDVPVTGQTIAQVQEKLQNLLAKDYLVNPQVTIFIEEYSTVSVMGEVKNPGAYPIKGRLSVVGLISLAEGFSETASPNEVKVIRNDRDGKKTEMVVPVLDIMSKNSADDQNLLLRSGDVVIVPKSTVSIMGEVKKSGVYPTRGRLTVVELISLAEGFTELASPNEVKVIRTNADGTKTETLVRVQDSINKETGDQQSFLLHSGDVVVVPEGKVSIMGEIVKPGFYPTKGRLSVLQLIAMAEGFTKIAAPNKVKVIHTNPDGSKTENVVRVGDIMNKDTANNDNLLLYSGDVVIVPESIF
ncbi:MAG: SLBB domain-containing protein [Candidatus Omnitrophica bacterium]|nr:SLBB domain-containing protein [Candidatus Omnitrophota bacterium]